MSRRVLTGVVALLVGAVAVAAFVRTRDGEPALTRDALLAYQAGIHPPLSDGGRTVQQGMKPAVADLRAGGGEVPPAAMAAEADAWVRDLTAVRAEVVAVEPPRALREAARLFAAALDGYVAAARAFGDAARAPAEGRGALLDGVVATAEAADRTYDDASRILQDWRRRLGLGATSEFPDP